MEKSLTIYEHGIEKFVSRSGKMRGDSVSIKLDIPKERQPDSTTLTVQIAPSMATTMLDALPYLIDYPYGCTEQTMSRFLPAVITAKTLARSRSETRRRDDRDLWRHRTESSAAATHPKGKRDLQGARCDHQAESGSSLQLPTRRRRLGLVEGRRQRSLHDRVRSLGHDARAPGRHRSEDGCRSSAPPAYLDKELVEEEDELRRAGLDAPRAWLSITRIRRSRRAGRASFRPKLSTISGPIATSSTPTRARCSRLRAHNFGYRDKAKTLVANLENGVKIDSTA